MASRSVKDRLFAKAAYDQNGCLVFTGGKHKAGYGLIWYQGKPVLAHRAAWFAHTGEWLPPHVILRHSCDNPPCINIDHLTPGTQAENIADTVAHGRIQRGENHWSQRTPECFARGEETEASKLTEAQVQEIRELVRLGEMSLRAIGRKYGVAHETIRCIVSKRTWAHLPELAAIISGGK